MAHFGPLLRKSGRATGQAALPIPTPLPPPPPPPPPRLYKSIHVTFVFETKYGPP